MPTLLSEHYTADLPGLLLPAEQYHPYPTAAERPAWGALTELTKAQLVQTGEQQIGCRWPPLPASLYMDYAATGNRRRYELPYSERRSALTALALAECAEGSGRFLVAIVDGVWAICEETSWVIPAHNWYGDRVAELDDPSIDLFSSDTASLLTWVHYLLRNELDQLSPSISRRIRKEVKKRLLDPFLMRDDLRWMGRRPGRPLNNWSPWCSSNCLASSLLLEDDPARRLEAVTKAMDVIDRWLAGYHSDGGCDEGPQYWGVAGGALFDCLELLRGATAGQIDVYREPLIQEIGRYIYRLHIAGDWFANFADGSAHLRIPAALVYRYGRRIVDPAMAALGAWADQRHGASWGEAGLLRALPTLFDSEGIAVPAAPPLVRDAWLDGIQAMAARERAGSDRGFYLAAKGGHNGESHNHNDVGQFIVFHDGKPLLVDVGVGTYTRETFDEERYRIWTMQSAYHNLPTVNGVQQRDGREFAARDVHHHVDDAGTQFTVDIAGAYPAEAGVRSWRRTLRLLRGEATGVSVTEEFALDSPAQVELSLMMRCRPELIGNGQIELGAEDQRIHLIYPPSLVPTIECIELDDEHLSEVWGDRLYRLILRAPAPVREGRWVIELAKH